MELFGVSVLLYITILQYKHREREKGIEGERERYSLVCVEGIIFAFQKVILLESQAMKR